MNGNIFERKSGISEIEESVCLNLMKRLREDNYRGLDPSAIRFSKKLLMINAKANQLMPRNLGEKILYKTLYYMGHRAVKFLNPIQNVYAKGLGLNLSTYSNLFNRGMITKDEFEGFSGQVFDLLNQKRINENEFLWAHEIEYFIKGEKITTSTPNLITTAFVALGVYDYYKTTHNLEVKEYFKSIIKDMLQVFPFTAYENEGCFMYTPVTNYHVHNANLLMSELLCLYQEINYEPELDRLIKLSTKYSINDFIETDTFFYAGPPTRNKTIDNYHTGFVLRSLKQIQDYLNTFDCNNVLLTTVDQVLNKGLKFYFLTFIKQEYVIRDHLNTLESHSLAESLLIYKTFRKNFSENEQHQFEKAILNSWKELWNEKEHYFYYTIRPVIGGLKVMDKTNMVRWSQSWMGFALSKTRD